VLGPRGAVTAEHRPDGRVRQAEVVAIGHSRSGAAQHRSEPARSHRAAAASGAAGSSDRTDTTACLRAGLQRPTTCKRSPARRHGAALSIQNMAVWTHRSHA
jgi:hypothetical protein